MMLVAEISLLADAFVLAVIAGFAFYGWQQGLFITTIAALQVLAAGLAALAFAASVAPLLESLGLSPDRSLPAAYVVVCAGSMLAGRLAVGAFVPRDAIGFARIIDTFLSAVIGGFAGLVLAGVILVGWSMMPLPDWARLRADGLRVDAGSWFLGSFSRCVQPAGPGRDVLLDGESAADEGNEAGRCSEPFVDGNRNGTFDEGERHLDLDGDGSFTPERSFTDINGNGRRDLGLRECYRLAAWKDLVVLRPPPATPAARDDNPAARR